MGVCKRRRLPLTAAPLFSLLGDLENFKKNPFIMKEGVEYKIKISFKVKQTLRVPVGHLLLPQVVVVVVGG